MARRFETQVGDFIESKGLFGSARRVLLAVSGGADSTALLYALTALRVRGVIRADFVCGHINHQLRASADADERFVVEQAGGLGLEAVTRRVDVRGFARRRKLSIETAGREVRISSLAEIAGQCGCEAIATAHHRDDNAETVVQRLVRGTGIRGLGGIWPVRILAGGFKFVRPMLCVGREEIIEYLDGRGLRWREDRTNADCAYRRNFIRHRLLPAVQADCGGSVAELLFRLSESARGYYGAVCERADEVWAVAADSGEVGTAVDLKKFSAEAAPVKVELIRRGLDAVGCGERYLTQGHYERILELAQGKVGGRRVELPGGYAVRREYARLIFEKSPGEANVPADEGIELKIPGRTVFGRYVIEANVCVGQEIDAEAGARRFVERFDFDEVAFPVVVRRRRAGDRFEPLGLGAGKKVGKFLSDARVPSDVREKILVVEDAERIIWVWPIRMSERAKVTSRTKKMLELNITCGREPGEGKDVEK